MYPLIQEATKLNKKIMLIADSYLP